jgi:ubiquinone/menaquinone biosynthesis C-methylase UbiE
MITRNQTRGNYNRLSKWYDFFAGSEKQFTDLGLQMLNIQAGEKILEIGCGTGRALLEITKNASPSGIAIGIDLSRGMLEVARNRVAVQRPAGQIFLVEGDAIHTPFNGDTFDAILLSFMLELFSESEMDILLKECHHILKHHGRIGIVALAKQAKAAVQIYEWFHKHFPVLVDCRPIFVQPIVKDAGFHLQQSTIKLMWGLPVEIIVAEK